MRLALLALLPACSLYFDGNAPPPDGSGAAPGTIQLTTVKTIAGEHRIVGVDSDHEGGVWIAYQELSSSELQITHLDAAGDPLSEWTYTDDPSEVSGIAFSDGLWVNTNANGSIGTDRVRKLDTITGATLQTFATPGQIADLEMQSGDLLLSSYQNQVIALDPSTGGQKWTMVTQVIPSTQKGIGAYGSKLFVSSWDMDALTLMDHAGHILGTATSPLLHSSVTASVGLFLAADGNDGLLLATDSQIAWLAVPQ